MTPYHFYAECIFIIYAIYIKMFQKIDLKFGGKLNKFFNRKGRKECAKVAKKAIDVVNVAPGSLSVCCKKPLKRFPLIILSLTPGLSQVSKQLKTIS
jgi:hypothetical protein